AQPLRMTATCWWLSTTPPPARGTWPSWMPAPWGPAQWQPSTCRTCCLRGFTAASQRRSSTRAARRSPSGWSRRSSGRS
ncbi:hypothetical protein MNEG_2957, partial [Monoraphidium neglectum]